MFFLTRCLHDLSELKQPTPSPFAPDPLLRGRGITIPHEECRPPGEEYRLAPGKFWARPQEMIPYGWFLPTRRGQARPSGMSRLLGTVEPLPILTETFGGH